MCAVTYTGILLPRCCHSHDSKPHCFCILPGCSLRPDFFLPSHRYSSFEEVDLSIGIKKLYMLCEMAKQSEEPADTFLYNLYEECKRKNRGY